MESDTISITREELEDFMRQVEGIKATIEILQDKKLMEEIRESENLRKQGAKSIKLNI